MDRFARRERISDDRFAHWLERVRTIRFIRILAMIEREYITREWAPMEYYRKPTALRGPELV